MHSRFADWPLRIKLAVAAAIVFSLLTLVLSWFTTARMGTTVTMWSERRAVGITTLLAQGLSSAMEFEDSASGAERLSALSALPGVMYALLYGSDRSVIAAWNGGDAPALEKLPGAEPDLLTLEDRLHVRSLVRGQGDTTGVLAVGFDLKEIRDERRRDLVVLIILSAGILAVAVLVFTAMGTWIARPMERLTETAKRIVATGDLSCEVSVTAHDETGQLAASFAQLVQRQRSILLAIKQLAGELVTVESNVATVAATITKGAGAIDEAVKGTMSAVVESIETLTNLDRTTQALKVDGEHGLTALEQVSMSNGVVLEKVEAMAGSVEGTSTAIELVSAGIAETSKNLQEISAFVMQTSSSMTQMDASLKNVQANADETAKLSQMVLADAEHAVGTVNETTAGIDRIRDVSKDGSRVIEELGVHIGEIGKIVRFITDVAGRTNLLSLNAAIVAAQAGEDGQAFAVVADEIKELANQTRNSSLEISKLVERIQRYAAEAVSSMGTSIRQVEEGVRLAGETRAALGKILQSAGSSKRMTDAIAATTVEQVKSSQLITTSIHRVVNLIEQISGSSSEQASHASQIVAATTQMRDLTRLVRQSATDETRVVGGLAGSVAKMVDRIGEVRGAQQSQTQGWSGVRREVETIREIVSGQQPTIQDLESALGALARQVRSLQDETARFRV